MVFKVFFVFVLLYVLVDINVNLTNSRFDNVNVDIIPRGVEQDPAVRVRRFVCDENISYDLKLRNTL